MHIFQRHAEFLKCVEDTQEALGESASGRGCTHPHVDPGSVKDWGRASLQERGVNQGVRERLPGEKGCPKG